MNSFTVVGNLTSDPEMKDGASGKGYATFSVAWNEKYRDGKGVEKEHTSFFRCIAYDKKAEFIGRHFSKGDRVLVSGKLRIEKYTPKDGGPERESASITVNEITHAQWKKTEKQQASNDDWV